jgi:hypothetical protein
MCKTFISRHILHQYWYTCPIALTVRRNPQHRSLLTVVSVTSVIGRASSATFERPWGNFSAQLWTALSDKHFTLRKQETFRYERPLHWVVLPTKTYNRTLLFGITLLKHGHHFDHWNQPLNTRMRVCYLDCHEARLCRYAVIHIENLLLQLQLFYFHLWPIYWLSLIHMLQYISSSFTFRGSSLSLFRFLSHHRMTSLSFVTKWKFLESVTVHII